MNQYLISALKHITAKLSPLSESDIANIKDIFDTLYGWEDFWEYEDRSSSQDK